MSESRDIHRLLCCAERPFSQKGAWCSPSLRAPAYGFVNEGSQRQAVDAPPEKVPPPPHASEAAAKFKSTWLLLEGHPAESAEPWPA